LQVLFELLKVMCVFFGSGFELFFL
jgi:hypothetical protein